MSDLPIVRLEIQHMQHSISMMISEHLGKLDCEAQAAVKAAVENFDYAGEVHKIAHDIIRESIKRSVEELFQRDSAPRQMIQRIAETLVRGALESEAGKFNITVSR